MFLLCRSSFLDGRSSRWRYLIKSSSSAPRSRGDTLRLDKTKLYFSLVFPSICWSYSCFQSGCYFIDPRRKILGLLLQEGQNSAQWKQQVGQNKTDGLLICAKKKKKVSHRLSAFQQDFSWEILLAGSHTDVSVRVLNPFIHHPSIIHSFTINPSIQQSDTGWHLLLLWLQHQDNFINVLTD